MALEFYIVGKTKISESSWQKIQHLDYRRLITKTENLSVTSDEDYSQDLDEPEDLPKFPAKKRLSTVRHVKPEIDLGPPVSVTPKPILKLDPVSFTHNACDTVQQLLAEKRAKDKENQLMVPVKTETVIKTESTESLKEHMITKKPKVSSKPGNVKVKRLTLFFQLLQTYLWKTMLKHQN